MPNFLLALLYLSLRLVEVFRQSTTTEGVQIVGHRMILPISSLTSAAFLLVEETRVSPGNKKAVRNCFRYNCMSHPLSLGFEPATTALNAE